MTRPRVDLFDESRQARLSLRLALACTLVFLSMLVAGAALLGRLMPPYLQNPYLRAGLEHLEAHGDRYDTFFIGSSRVSHHIVPALFDASTADAGAPTVSFNFGVGGMQGLELEFLLDQVLALPLRRLRWVWIEPGDAGYRTEASNRTSERFTAWHDLRHTWRALDLLRGGARPGYDWPTWLREHVPALVRHELQIGRAGQRLRRRPMDPGEFLGPQLDGYRALDWSKAPHVRQSRARFLDDLDGYRERRALLARQAGRVDRPLEPFERRFLLRLRRAVEAVGARPIFLVGPALGTKGEYLARAAAEDLIPVVFNYANPIAYPDFYALELRFDAGHLNHAGANLYTRRLALDFARYASDGTSADQASQRIARGAASAPDQNWK